MNKVSDMLQVVNKEAQSLLLAFGFLPLTLSKYSFAGQGILGLEQQWLLCYIFSSKKNTCSKSATKTLEITDDNPKENIFE